LRKHAGIPQRFAVNQQLKQKLIQLEEKLTIYKKQVEG